MVNKKIESQKYALPTNWSLCSIDEVAYVNPETLSPSKTANNYRFEYIDIASIAKTGKIKDTKIVEFSKAPSRARRVVIKGDTIVSTVRPYLKGFAFIKYESDLPQICSTGFAVLRVKKDIDPDFIYQSILDDKFVSYLETKMTGSNYPAVKAGDIKEYKLGIPNFSEQKKIAEILNTVDSVIESTEEIIEQTKKVKKGLMQQLLIKGIGHSKFKNTVIGQIPEEWEVKDLDSLFEFFGGMPFSRSSLGDEGAYYLHYGDIHKMDKIIFDTRVDSCWLPRINIKEGSIREDSLLQTGDIVFADASEDTEGIAKSVVVINDKNKPFISGLHTIIAKEKLPLLDIKYKQYCFANSEIKKQFLKIATGATVYGISKSNIKSIKIPVPPIEEQKKIGDILQSFDEKIQHEQKKLIPLTNLKNGLMQVLLTGKVRVKVDEKVVSHS
ncbi:restriction endonuclease subunit S [Neobacillus sp. OS1-33]|uniref:restriction endonuclease subunit S n=1 Tax=Neobacillus sp. OS1-33 TaxID=3070683 RepID=UPI0027E1F956|nr:restriction endonuclease subunit S [Neobacillus sp. OS1-33]WML26277.1 restriction endonuclease subunit S [Neobacillus sp. OS1-33]